MGRKAAAQRDRGILQISMGSLTRCWAPTKSSQVHECEATHFHEEFSTMGSQEQFQLLQFSRVLRPKFLTGADHQVLEAERKHVQVSTVTFWFLL